jgi:hypothetical protein
VFAVVVIDVTCDTGDVGRDISTAGRDSGRETVGLGSDSCMDGAGAS